MMQPLFSQSVASGVAHVAHTTKFDGDLSPSGGDPATLQARRSSVVDLPWRSVVQVHGDRVVWADRSSGPDPRPVGDALVTDAVDLAIAVHSGDCVPVGFVSDAGLIGVAHAGWKGLEAGVLESTVRTLRAVSPAATVRAAVGPHIRAANYEFGDHDLRRMSRRLDKSVAATTAAGRPALDMTEAIRLELARLDVDVAASSPACTAELEDDYWSHRQRSESGRIALVAWIESP